MSPKPPRPGMICHHEKIGRDGHVEREWRDPPKHAHDLEFEERPGRVRRGVMAGAIKPQGTLL